MPDLEIRGCGHGWVVLAQGARVGPVFREHSTALAGLKGIERRLRRASARQRPCLCCGRAFRSEGPHNRMCDPCRGGYR